MVYGLVPEALSELQGSHSFLEAILQDVFRTFSVTI